MKVKIVYGANYWYMPNFDGNDGTVGQLKEEYCEQLSIPKNLPTHLGESSDSRIVKDDYTLRDGDVIEFKKATGTKG